MNTVIVKPSRETLSVNKSVIGSSYAHAEMKRKMSKFFDCETLGKVKICGDIVSPLYKEIDD